MRWHLISRSGARGLIALALMAALASGIAYASGSSGSSAVIHACFRLHGGQLRVIDASTGGHCRDGSTLADQPAGGSCQVQSPTPATVWTGIGARHPGAVANVLGVAAQSAKVYLTDSITPLVVIGNAQGPAAFDLSIMGTGPADGSTARIQQPRIYALPVGSVSNP